MNIPRNKGTCDHVRSYASKHNLKIRRRIIMKKLYLIIFLLVVGLATSSFAKDKSFKAMLSGSEIVPAVETMAKGDATFTLIKDEKALSYYVTVSDIENVTAAHIHLGKKGENGPPVALISNEKKAGKFSG